MARNSALLAGFLAAIPLAAPAGQHESYDYWRFDRELVRRGQQALFMCNGLFTSNRSLEQVFAQELAYLPEPVGTAQGGAYEVERARRAVTVGAEGYVPPMRAASCRALSNRPARTCTSKPSSRASMSAW